MTPKVSPRGQDSPFGSAPGRPAPERRPEPWQPRFGIRELLMLMLITSMLAAAFGYLYQDEKTNDGKSVRFIFITVAGPPLMAAMLGAAFLGYEYFWPRKRKKRRSTPD